MVLLEGKHVTTLEGLGTITEPAPIQRAFMEERPRNAAIASPA